MLSKLKYQRVLGAYEGKVNDKKLRSINGMREIHEIIGACK